MHSKKIVCLGKGVIWLNFFINIDVHICFTSIGFVFKSILSVFKYFKIVFFQAKLEGNKKNKKI